MLKLEIKHPFGDARSRRLEEIVKEFHVRTTQPADMADAVYGAMMRRMAIHQLVDEELHRKP